MSNGVNQTFRCTVITPEGKRLDCDTNSVEVPAHDGQLGIWANHSPLFCQLGMGLMKVTEIRQDEIPCQHEIIIDGGFALVASNSLMVLAYEAITPAHCAADKIEGLRERLQKQLNQASQDEQRQHDRKKIALVERLAQNASM
jgi:F-type H+-transporting ATPase subunit epsilon